ncbi:MAG: hypothetical protein NWE93_05605 [Candidatus Bathyarchaeota archaeon]|nr:hypothetical protein [Candidatus Bathyarchaeota archaeon]
MTTQPKKGINTKIIAAIAIIIIAISLSAVAAQYMLNQQTQPPLELPDMTLTLVGSDGQQQTLTKTDILSLQAYTADGGIRTSNGEIKGVGTYTGVAVTTLLELVGGIESDQTLTATASDGYTMAYSYNQIVNGADFTTYDPATRSQTDATQPLKLVLTYSIDGAALPSDEGPLRMGVLGSEGLATQGNLWEKMVVKLQVNLPPEPTSTSTPSPTAKPTAKPTTTSSNPTATPTPTPTPISIPATQLTIIGADGTTTVTLNEASLVTYAQTSGLGGKFKSQTGTTDYGTYTGISITTLLNLVGGLSSTQVLCVTAADGYAKNYTYTQVTGPGLTMYDPVTNATVTPTYPVTMIVAYYYNGTAANLPVHTSGAYLETAFVGQDGLSTTANLFSKYTVTLRVYNA